MTLLQLQYFRTLAYILHYTKTAEKLSVSQPSLSYAINELEKELGVRLFDKEKRAVRLTPYGQQFLLYVERSLNLLEEGQNVLKQMQGRHAKIVRLGYFHSISASLVPNIVDAFIKNEAQGKIRFSFFEGPSFDIFQKIKNGELDMGFCLHRGDFAKSVEVMLQPLYLAVASSHPLARRESVTFSDFEEEPQIMLEQSSNLRGQVDAAFERRGIIPNVAFVVRECNAALQYVGLELGVSILPKVPVMNLEKVRILPIFNDGVELVRAIYFTWNAQRPMSAAAKSFRDYIVDNYARGSCGTL